MVHLLAVAPEEVVAGQHVDERDERHDRYDRPAEQHRERVRDAADQLQGSSSSLSAYPRPILPNPGPGPRARRAASAFGVGFTSCRPVEAAVRPEDRLAHNETLFRDVNERIEAGQWPTQRGEKVAFRCECGSLRCNMLVELTIAEYEHVRATGTHFLIISGHEIPAIERVVERGEDYAVVEKMGRSAEIAEETDPRDP